MRNMRRKSANRRRWKWWPLDAFRQDFVVIQGKRERSEQQEHAIDAGRYWQGTYVQEYDSLFGEMCS